MMKHAARRIQIAVRHRAPCATIVVSLAGVTALAFARFSLAQAQEDPAGVIQPDPAIQEMIRSVARPASEAELRELLDQMRRTAGPGYQSLVPQLLLFTIQADNTRDAMVFGVIVRELAIPDRALAEALIPFLETPDDRLNKQVHNLLGGFEDRSADRPPDFSLYRQIIADRLRAGDEPPAPLIQYMYETDPGRALQTLVRAYGLRNPAEIKPILWAEHVVADALWKQQFGFTERGRAEPAVLAEMDTLSRDGRWWVRLYVAQVARAHPEFATPDLVIRLRQDSHERVRRTAPLATER